jgi:hypothetical protein
MKTREIGLSLLIMSLFRHPKQTLSAALLAFLVFFAVQTSYGAVATRVGGGLTAPAGIVFLGADPWVSDHLLGFCRLDLNPVTGIYTLNPATCNGPAAPAVGQAAVAANGTDVYVADNDAGLLRMTFNPGSRTVSAPVVVAPLTATIADLPQGCAFGPDGNIYVSYARRGDIERITPGGAVTTIGAESAGTAVMAMAFVGTNLFLAASGTPEVIEAAPGCGANACTGSPVATPITLPTAIVTDGTNLFIGTASAVYRFDTLTPTVASVLFANGGTIPPALTVLPFQNLSALGVTGTTLLAADDPTLGAFPLGRLWRMLTTDPPGPSFPTLVLGSPAGAPGNLTAPTGLIWLPGALGGHFWVSDHLFGFCRLDPDPTGLIISFLFCNTSTTSPGQAAFDPARNLVYLPDTVTAGNNQGIQRLTFDPATETITGAVPIINDPAFLALQSSSLTFGPDGKVYIGFVRTPLISRIANPHGPTPTLEPVGTEPGGLAVTQLAFVNNDLFIAGSSNLGRINNAAACTGTCPATAVVGAQIATPFALAYDGSRFLYVGTGDTVWRFNPTTGIAEVYSNLGNTTVPPVPPDVPYATFGALALDPAGALFGTDDPSGVANPLVARLWEIRPYLLPIKNAKTAKVGETVSFTLSFKNTSGAADTFNLTYTGNAWTTTGPATTGPMAINAGLDVVVQVTIPPGVSPKLDTVTVTAAAVSNAAKFTVADLITNKTLSLIYLPVILR